MVFKLIKKNWEKVSVDLGLLVRVWKKSGGGLWFFVKRVWGK